MKSLYNVRVEIDTKGNVTIPWAMRLGPTAKDGSRTWRGLGVRALAKFTKQIAAKLNSR